MKAILLRTASGPTQIPLALLSPGGSFSDQNRGIGISFSGGNSTSSPRSSLHFEMKEKKQVPTSFRRALSDTDLIQSEKESSGMSKTWNREFSRSFQARIVEEDLLDVDEDDGSSILKWKDFDIGVSDRAAGIASEELEFSGGGMGKGRKLGGGNGGGDGRGGFADGNADQNKLAAYYEEMLKVDPGNPLLLRNYGKYLHEVEKDFERAEECYGRAILASPGDGEVLSLYGKLIWETQKDQGRAKRYFDQAIQAAPNDCYVLGSYANFLWEADEDEEEGDKGMGLGAEEERKMDGRASTLVEAC